MTTHKDNTKPFYIALDLNQNVFHYAKLSNGNQVSTKHQLEIFATQKQWLDRLVELTVFPTEDELENI